MPKVSVIIPVYGVEKYIERCARSLFEQTLDDIEFLFIDDCTPDNSIEVLKRVLEDYPSRKHQVLIHRMEQNSGQAAVRKWGMQNATGDYLIHCDSDDRVDISIYEKLWKKAIEDEADIVRCSFVRTDGVNEVLCRQIPEDAYGDRFRLISYALIGSSFTSLCDKLVKRTVITENEITYPTYDMQEDASLVVQLLYYSKKVASLPEVLYYYCVNPTSKTQTSTIESYLKKLDEVCNNTKLITTFLDSKGVLDSFHEELVCRKYNDRSHIIALTNQRKYKKMWWTIYPEIDKKILFNTKMHFKEKLEYYCVKFGMYHFIRR